MFLKKREGRRQVGKECWNYLEDWVRTEEKIAVGMYLLWVVQCLSTCSRRMKESQK